MLIGQRHFWNFSSNNWYIFEFVPSLCKTRLIDDNVFLNECNKVAFHDRDCRLLLKKYQNIDKSLDYLCTVLSNPNNFIDG